ncbi:MAG: GTPase ObgE [Candidatus Shapirobacteria bacterium]|jgi:GTP-binding protein
MLIDESRITVKAGNGGKGLVHFFTDKSRPKGGPDGGNGGAGGNLYFKAVSDISRLHQFRHKRIFQAPNGDPGGPNQRTGHDGADLTLEIPIGTIVHYDNGSIIEFTKVGQTEIIVKGGKGGRGNYHFRSSTNQTPQESEPGIKPLPRNLFIELKLIANVGLIGLPNAGKTSLLNELTSANAKVANYPFTTLEPNLGVTKGGKVIADIPGLIEGATTGHGLGSKFLKHIERTNLLVHCLSLESQNLSVDYQTIRHELESYSTALAKKPEIIILTKSDLVDPKDIKSLLKSTKAVLAVSIADDQSIKALNDLIALKLDSF